jgi:hypothetical protein
MPTANTYRTIYQQSNLFVYPVGLSGVTATGQSMSSGNSGFTYVGELSRVQSVDLSSTINRTDIDVFGRLARIDSEIISPPTFTMNFSYLLTDGKNEDLLGFQSKGGGSFVSGIITKQSHSKNYLISYAPPGQDDDGYTPYTSRDVAALGNGFISNYSINAAVNQPVTASVTVDGLNIASFTGASGNSPAINPANAQRITTWQWQLPVGAAQTGAGTISIIKPGDITLNIPNNAAFMSIVSGDYGAPIQSFTLSIPIVREKIQALGSPFGVSEEITFPVNCTLSIQGLQTNLQPASFDTLLCNDVPYDLNIILRQPSCNGTGMQAVVLGFNQAYMSSHRISQSIGGNASLALDFSSQLQGPTSVDGITFSGFFS